MQQYTALLLELPVCCTICKHEVSPHQLSADLKVGVATAVALQTIYRSGGPEWPNSQSGLSEKDSDSLSVHVTTFETRCPLQNRVLAT